MSALDAVSTLAFSCLTLQLISNQEPILIQRPVSADIMVQHYITVENIILSMNEWWINSIFEWWLFEWMSQTLEAFVSAPQKRFRTLKYFHPSMYLHMRRSHQIYGWQESLRTFLLSNVKMGQIRSWTRNVRINPSYLKAMHC